MTYREALAAGYRDADARMYRGYVSRKIDIMAQEVQIAGGSRKGELYVELPNPRSTYYGLLRQYLYKPEK